MPKPKTATGEKNLISKRLIELREKKPYVPADACPSASTARL